MQEFAAVERGRYLASAADCGSCHTIPGSDHPFSGGRPIETPFGVLVAPNITPDRETGIGAWSDEEFDAAVRSGRRRDGKRLYPAMPFPYFARMTSEDVKDIRAYLSTIDPVRNPVTVNHLPFPLNQRMAMAVWDELYFTPGTFKDEASKSEQWTPACAGKETVRQAQTIMIHVKIWERPCLSEAWIGHSVGKIPSGLRITA